jgi:hypothetical protein
MTAGKPKPRYSPEGYLIVKAPRLSAKALAAIERIARWEDDSHRAVLGEEPPHPWPERSVRRSRRDR